MELLDHIRKNSSLKVIDASSGEVYAVKDLIFDLGESLPDKGLVFLYTDNTIHDVKLYLSLLNSRLCIALLNRKILNIQKQELEEIYRPEVIYDPSRANPEGFEEKHCAGAGYDWKLFFNNRGSSDIHPDIKLLLSTSGSTGSPKFVKLSAQNLYENARSIAEYLPILPNDVAPLNLPINYSYGLSILHSNALKAGTLVCGLPDLLSPSFWDLLKTYGFSTLAGVPYMYEMMARLGFLNNNYPTLRYITEAGGNLNMNLKEQFYQWCISKDVAFYIMYGQTEATARISYNHVNAHPDKIASIGKPIPRGHLALDEQTEELLYMGPNIFGGYAQNRNDLRKWETIDVLKTGDIARRDDKGFYFITGRLKRIVKLFGNRINLDEVERFLKNQVPEGLVACGNLNDKYLLVSLSPNPALKDRILKLLKQKYQFPVQVIKFNYISEFPVGSNGKVSYDQLKQLYIEKESTS